ncbi:MAG: OB-fold nucleic acid binding domain-containing protein [Candidatus Bathyarchaeota archaeon]|nr:OB-fold nucleic acid binding domain-containing protein [Candidatus Bathyarchaeota archaeon]
MSTEEIIRQILAKHPEVSRKQILENLEIEKNKTGGLIAEETLLRLIAARYGVEITKAQTKSRLQVTHLVPGLNDVTVTGRVIAIYSSKSFDGEKSGKLASIIIADRHFTMRVILWNAHAELIEKETLKVGQIVRLLHGYTREDHKGRVELHLGSKSQIEIEPEDAKTEDYPTIAEFATKISKINKTLREAHIVGIVKSLLPATKFTRGDMSEGTVLRFTLADETGETQVVAWNEKAEELTKILKINAKLLLVNARIRENANGKLEVHADASTYVEVLDSSNF